MRLLPRWSKIGTYPPSVNSGVTLPVLRPRLCSGGAALFSRQVDVALRSQILRCRASTHHNCRT
jgi:hypothetical protein